MAIYDADTARGLLERAIAHESKPSLAESDVDLLMQIAVSLDDEGATVYASAALNKSAALGWNWKSGLTSDQYDLGGGPGIVLKRDQFFAHCREMAAAYGSGTASVDGTPRTTGSGIGSVAVVSSTAASYWEGLE